MINETFIAEKPSLAKAIFEGLGGNPNTEKKNGYFEHGSDVVTGVMVICWSFTTHRIMTTNIPTGVIVIYPLKRFIRQNIKIKPESEAQTRIIFALIDKADSIVHSGDPDDEGCLLVDEILGYAGNKKPVQRLLVADSTLRQCKNHCRIYNLTINFAV